MKPIVYMNRHGQLLVLCKDGVETSEGLNRPLWLEAFHKSNGRIVASYKIEPLKYDVKLLEKIFNLTSTRIGVL